MPRRKRTSRRRPERRQYETLSLDKSLDILELLAAHPGGLTVPEIVARLQRPASPVIRTIAIMQGRHWLWTDERGDRLKIGRRILELSAPGGKE